MLSSACSEHRWVPLIPCMMGAREPHCHSTHTCHPTHCCSTHQRVQEVVTGDGLHVIQGLSYGLATCHVSCQLGTQWDQNVTLCPKVLHPVLPFPPPHQGKLNSPWSWPRRYRSQKCPAAPPGRPMSPGGRQTESRDAAPPAHSVPYVPAVSGSGLSDHLNPAPTGLNSPTHPSPLPGVP